MRNLSVFALALLLAGCLGSGPDDVGPSTTSTGSDEACGASQQREASEQAPGLAARSAANEYDAAGGNRTVRWDLVVEGACQDASATAQVTATLTTPPQDCPDVALRGTVSTGVSETEIPLSEGETRSGSRDFTPQRTDLGEGAGTFVVSLAATMESQGFAPHDEQCLDATLASFRLAADFRAD